MFNPTANLDAAYAMLGVDPSAPPTARSRRPTAAWPRSTTRTCWPTRAWARTSCKFAEEKMQAVNAAYDQIKKERGL